MLLVVDANIIISSLVGGNLADLLFSPKLEFIAPELLFVEVKKHIEEIKEKSKLSKVEVETLLVLLERRVRTVPLEDFKDRFEEAEALLGDHKKDVPYLALALKQGCSFWSYEKRFAKIGKVECLSTKEVRDRVQH